MILVAVYMFKPRTEPHSFTASFSYTRVNAIGCNMFTPRTMSHSFTANDSVEMFIQKCRRLF